MVTNAGEALRTAWPHPGVGLAVAINASWIGALASGFSELFLIRPNTQPKAWNVRWGGTKARSSECPLTFSECAENARLREWYAAQVENNAEKKFLPRMAKWQALAAERELPISAFARSTL
jgi:hypothetical protein